ncbi:hypothetical protein IMSAG025_00379 [Muribaculaceae bacterium]|nr:hypothetical protein IMSAG025_00379 [Muribaculaceae bacterium]
MQQSSPRGTVVGSKRGHRFNGYAVIFGRHVITKRRCEIPFPTKFVGFKCRQRIFKNIHTLVQPCVCFFRRTKESDTYIATVLMRCVRLIISIIHVQLYILGKGNYDRFSSRMHTDNRVTGLAKFHLRSPSISCKCETSGKRIIYSKQHRVGINEI